MKKIVVNLMMLCVGLSFAQKERTLVLNEDTRLIEVTYFHDNGEVSQTGFYTEEGKLHGEWIKFCKEGNRLAEARYNNGNKVGKWLFYDGNTIKEVNYSENLVTEVVEKTTYTRAVASNR